MTDAKNWKLGLSSCSTRRVDEDTFAAYAAAGIEILEVSLPPERYADTDWTAVRALSERYGVTVRSFHLPYSPFERNNIASPDEDLRRSTVALHRQLLRAAATVGATVAVIHPSGEPNEPGERPRLMEAARRSLAELAPAAEALGISLAVEDLPRTGLGRDSAEILDLLRADDRLRVCFDTNHLLGGERPEDFARAVGSRIVTVHVSDYDFRNERHWLPGEGKNDWPAIVSALEAADYAGPLLYEVPFAAPDTIRRPRPLTPADIVRNRAALAEKRVPPPFGVPDEAVCLRRAWTG